MKLFLRDHIPLLFLYFAQLVLIFIVYWLDGYRNLMVSLYAAMLSTVLLIGYLVYRFYSNRSFYKRLEEPFTSLDEFAPLPQASLLSEELNQLLDSQFRLYRTDLHTYKKRLDNHIQFINQWVHQMKTPVSVIHLLVQEGDDPRFAAIGDEVDRLRKGLEMVLYTSRLDTFERDFFVETLPLENVVRSVTSSQKRLFIRNRVFPVIEVDKEMMISSDEKWLSFVITQIITNAIRYTTKENAKLYFKSYTHGVHKVLEIRDEGVGIPSSDLPRVFDPYFTGENGRSFQESTGMGLYLSKQICEKLGHQIEMDSVHNEGTTVRILF
ncbi:sensor histidine kinase [Bacillus sp. REN16]|uniref:sensor histidine kinase n=1 Tax=Bacillus sp. REN16 TaxID=2887296 RepID=UPI001E58D7C0|nr:sensor histidine kinase [Bacillus sp. REN16]MCC3358104.1 sensor histidine kinase [Bacillus sp. REN16]